MPKTLRQQLDDLKVTLRTLKFAHDSPFLTNVIDVIAHFPGTITDTERTEIGKLIHECFSLSVEQSAKLDVDIRPVWEPDKIKTSFDALVPKGWLSDYIDGTYESESPTVYHFMCAATILGAMTDRRIWHSKGHYRIFPNLNVILIGPAGKVKKTSAINIALDIVMRAGYEKIVLGQTTPEAFLMNLGSNDPASCLVIGREMAAFFHKAKYMDGIIPLFTDLIDCPNIWSSLTVARGNLKVRNVMQSGVYGTTMDWLNNNMPADIYGGGFMRRHLQAFQERTDRIVARPKDMDPQKAMLAESLKIITYPEGECPFDLEAGLWYDDWYAKAKKGSESVEDERFAGYLESKPDFVIRLAMIIQVSKGAHLLTIESLNQSLAILEWLEQFLPIAFASMASTPLGEHEDRILKILRRAGGRLSHSDLVRRMSKHMTASQLATIIFTLKEAEMLEERPRSALEARSYHLTKRSAGAVA